MIVNVVRNTAREEAGKNVVVRFSMAGLQKKATGFFGMIIPGLERGADIFAVNERVFRNAAEA
jgi:hypothetical protein